VIRLAVALDRSRVVGSAPGGEPASDLLPAALPEVMSRLYASDNVVVGAASLSARFATGPYRTCYVLTRDPEYVPPMGFERVVPVHDVMDLVHRYADSDDELLVAGGPTAWRLFTTYARRIDVAELAEPVAGDLVYDEFENGDFTLVRQETWEGGRTLHFERAHLNAEPHPTE
jgi:hypothetical protein